MTQSSSVGTDNVLSRSRVRQSMLKIWIWVPVFTNVHLGRRYPKGALADPDTVLKFACNFFSFDSTLDYEKICKISYKFEFRAKNLAKFFANVNENSRNRFPRKILRICRARAYEKTQNSSDRRDVSAVEWVTRLVEPLRQNVVDRFFEKCSIKIWRQFGEILPGRYLRRNMRRRKRCDVTFFQRFPII